MKLIDAQTMCLKQLKYTCCFIFLLSFALPKSQAQRFQLGLIGGINLSELAGDDISSYVGLHTGLKIATRISPRLDISTDFLYSQAGEYVTPIAYPRINYGKIHLNYLEIPVYLTFLAYPKEDFFQKKFSFGLAYTKLLSHKVENSLGESVSEQVIWDNRNTILGVLGVSHHFNKHFELNFRAALAKNELDWAWTLSFRGIYTLSI